MPVTVHNPYSGKDEETCSVSFEAQSKLSQTGVSGSQTEAQWSQSKLLGEWGVIQGKVANGQIPNGTKVLAYIKPSGAKGYIHVKNGKLHKVEFVGTQRLFDSEVLHPKDIDYWIKATGYKVSIPQAVAPKPKPEAVLLSGNDISSIDNLDIDKIPHDKVFAVNEAGDYVTFDGNFKNWQLHTEDPSTGKKTTTPGLFFEDLVHPGEGWLKPDGKTDTAKDAPKTTSGGKEHESQVAAPTPVSPVQGGGSVGSMSDEDVATMFVSIKDGMAKEQGLNIKGANPELDQQVYKAIGLKTGYTAAEVKGKIDQYKAAGNKLSALKKKVLSGSKKVPDPKPNDVPTKATATIVNDVKKTIVDEVKKEPAKHYSDEDVVAQYIIAKDQVVAESNGKWTLYTKSDELDKAIADQVKAKTGLDALQQKHAMASYLGSGKKVSVLKKQLIKQGALKPQADTLKKSGNDKTQADKAKDIEDKAKQGYTPTSTPATGNPPVDTGKAAPNNVEKNDARLGDITQVPEALHASIYQAYKNKNAYLSSPPVVQFVSMQDVLSQFNKAHNAKYTMLQFIRIIDDESTKKHGGENEHKLENKLVGWLSSPEYQKYKKEKKDAADFKENADALINGQPALPADSGKFKVVTPQEASELHARMQASDPWESSQIAAIKRYTGEDYTEMNNDLRDPIKTPGNADIKDSNEQAIKGMRPIPEDILLHRGAGSGRGQFGVTQDHMFFELTGKLLEERGFLSTSVGGRAAFGSTKAVLEVEVPKGTLGVYVKSISYHEGEDELILKPGTRYRVLRVTEVNSQFIVRVRVESQ